MGYILMRIRDRLVSLFLFSSLLVLSSTSCHHNRTSCADQDLNGRQHDVSSGEDPLLLEIVGLVKQPLKLTRTDLEKHPAATVRTNDVTKDGTYRGVFHHRGVPLKVLLEQAKVEKGDAVFGREMDLAVIVSNRAGEKVVLSWGEVFYRNPAETIIAYDGSPHMPHKPCKNCHDEETYGPWLGQLERRVPYPKLVPSRDFYADRALEGITRVEVTDPGANTGISIKKENRPERLFADKIAIHGISDDPAPIIIDTLDGFSRITGEAIQAGDGTGYHGVKRYAGAPLGEVLAKVGLVSDAETALLLSAPDGYRILLSAAEVFSINAGRDIVLADKREGEPIEDGGRFQLMLPGDHSADRWLKSVARIDVLRLGEPSR